MIFSLLEKKLEAMAKKAGGLAMTNNNELHVQDICDIAETIRDGVALPLDKLVLAFEQETKVAKEKAKAYKEKVHRILAGLDADAEAGKEAELIMEGSEQTSSRVDQPENSIADAGNASHGQGGNPESCDMVNLYDSETDEETVLSRLPYASANANSKKAYVETDDESICTPSTSSPERSPSEIAREKSAWRVPEWDPALMLKFQKMTGGAAKIVDVPAVATRNNSSVAVSDPLRWQSPRRGSVTQHPLY
jgi:hypothetical protein